MKPQKYSFQDSQKVDLGSKKIYKYPTPTKKLDVARMVVTGRHPEKQNTFLLERKCMFVMYILKGTGIVYAGEDIFEVKKKDVIFVPTNHKFAVGGKLEYLTIDKPAFFPEQSTEITVE